MRLGQIFSNVCACTSLPSSHGIGGIFLAWPIVHYSRPVPKADHASDEDSSGVDLNVATMLSPFFFFLPPYEKTEVQAEKRRRDSSRSGRHRVPVYRHVIFLDFQTIFTRHLDHLL